MMIFCLSMIGLTGSASALVILGPAEVQTLTGPHTASVTLDPGFSAQWSITGGTLLSAAIGATVQFQAGSGPFVTLTCTVSNGTSSAISQREIVALPFAPRNYLAELKTFLNTYRNTITADIATNNIGVYYSDSYYLMGIAAAADATGDTTLIDTLLGYTDQILAQAQPMVRNGITYQELGPPASDGRPQQSVTWMMSTALARTAAVINSHPEFKTKYGAKADQLVAFVDESVFKYWFDKNTGVYAAPTSPWPAGYIPWLSPALGGGGGYDYFTQQIMQLGMVATWMYQATKSPMYLDAATRIATQFKTADLTAMNGYYMWDLGKFGFEAPDNQEGCIDTSHSNRVPMMMEAMYDNGIVFTASDMDMMGKALVEVIWNQNETSPMFSNYINGSNKPYRTTTAPGSNGLIYHGWNVMGRHWAPAQRVLALTYQLMRTNSSINVSVSANASSYGLIEMSGILVRNVAGTVNNTVVDTASPTISAVSAGSIGTGSAVISWTTNEAADTQIEFGPTTAYGSQSTLNGTDVTSHSASLSGLSASTLYHYRVKSRDAAGNLATSGDFSFTTTVAPDTTAPTISAMAAGSITSASAVIDWTTNEVADTQMEFGLTTAYGQSSTLAAGMVTSHSVGLSGLSANTLYHFRVKSRDAAGNLGVSGDSTFTTLAVVVPVAVNVSPLSASVKATFSQQFTAAVTGTSNTGVTWLVNGIVSGNATVGKITSSGLYTAPAVIPNPATVTVSAKSLADASKSGSASVTILPKNRKTRVSLVLSPTANASVAAASPAAAPTTAILTVTTEDTAFPSAASLSAQISMPSGVKSVTMTRMSGLPLRYYCNISSATFSSADFQALEGADVTVTAAGQAFLADGQSGGIEPELGGLVKEPMGLAQVVVPPSGVSQSATIDIAPEPTDLSQQLAADALKRQGLVSLGAGRDIVMTSSGTLNSATLVLPFDPSLLPAGRDLSNVRIAYFNPATNAWELQEAAVVWGNTV
ncbi:MAG: fibronectin type III domain-containing protein, partial [Elusimicrobiota bacterium]